MLRFHLNLNFKLLSLFTFSLGTVLVLASAHQTPIMPTVDEGSNWRLTASSEWDVLGPFPIHAREQQFLSPAFPLNLSETVDFNETWPSAYADGGRVGWDVVRSDGEELKVSFPHIRWKALRDTEGWAALQHHAVLRTVLTVHPPEHRDGTVEACPPLRMNIIQASYFTVLPSSNGSYVPEWHAGNIYDMERALPRTVNLPHPPSTTSPTEYQLYLSGDYEIRLFGDPHVQGSEVPVQAITVQIQLEQEKGAIVHEPTQDVIPDFLDGFAFGESIGIGLRSLDGWWTVKEVYVDSPEAFRVQLMGEIRLAPSQLRVVPLSVIQDTAIESNEIKLSIKATSETRSITITVSVKITHKSSNLRTSWDVLKASLFYATTMPSIFLVVPPAITDENKTYPLIVALHGAGVDIIGDDFWSSSLPKTQHNWVVIPSGRTSWGLDWHGSSAADVWNAVAALPGIISKTRSWNGARIASELPVILMGHSNGGQGAWYIASRYPDRVVGVIPAAAYIKSQAYVALSMSRSAHFIDPALRSILESSLTPDDNDIHLSNLAYIPILAIHGGADQNVPPWHSREALGVVDYWSTRPNTNTTHMFREDPGEGHWYSTVLDNEQVVKFVDTLNNLPDKKSTRESKFTVTTADPLASGSLNGWRIEQLSVPGRIGRLTVDHELGKVPIVRTVNTERFSVNLEYYKPEDRFDCIQVEESVIHFRGSFVVFEKDSPRSWRISASRAAQSPSRIQAILSSSAPLILAIPDFESAAELSVASRFAHDLHLYHRLDAEIMEQQKVVDLFSKPKWIGGNMVFIGPPSSSFVSHVLRSGATPIQWKDNHIHVNGVPTAKDEQAIMFLHPNPLDNHSSILFCLYDSHEDLERIARLLPIRTGVTVPSWIILDDVADKVGAAGVQGAGVWGPSWNWNEQMSWYY